MTGRRFTDKPDLDPSAVMGLALDHAALTENRTLFPSTVVDVDSAFTGNLLVSGINSRKLGETIAKGKFKGYKLYSLTLEERATCSSLCEMRGACYGNGVQLARRHRIVDMDVFAQKIEDEIREILLEPGSGLMVRLHVLGDFPSVEYVAMWTDLLADHERLAVFGYTHWLPWPRMPDKGEIGKAIEKLKTDQPERFRIRWSTKYRMRDGACVIDYIPEKPTVAEGVVCPAQTDATACCASCGLCWEGVQPIAFIKHGRASVSAAAAIAMADAASEVRVPPAPLPAPVIDEPTLPARNPVKAEDFGRMLVVSLPKLKPFALELCSDQNLTQDLIQATALKAMEKREQFESGTNLDAWLAVILRNHYFSRHRTAHREVGDVDGSITERSSNSAGADEAIDARRAMEKIDDLSPHMASALRMAGAGHTYEEMAQREGVAIGTMKSRVSRARDALEEAVQRPTIRTDRIEIPYLKAKGLIGAPPEIVAELSLEAQAMAAPVNVAATDDNTRPIMALKLPSKPLPATILTDPPEMRLVAPTELRVEAAYQRDLSGKSIRLIRKIVAEWAWAKFKPPVCAETPTGLFVIDGQHTAIAAASHPKIERIPVMIATAAAIHDRAGAFVAHNRDRLAMSPLQILHAEAVAGAGEAFNIFRIVEDCGAFVPRSPSVKPKEGEVVAAGPIRRVFKQNGEGMLRRVVSIAVAASCKPITSTVIFSLQILLSHSMFEAARLMRDSQIADALHSIKDFERAAALAGSTAGINRYSAGARLIAEACGAVERSVAA